MTATVFDIQSGSFVDGDGVRMAIFFKGCNLDCKWCHNPESKSPKKQHLFYSSKCISCGECAKLCSKDAIKMKKISEIKNSKEMPVVSMKKCNLCDTCSIFCPTQARDICGRTYTVEGLFAKVIQEKQFFDRLGEGGVTLSGGEPLLQIDFVCELLALCKKVGINTAIDTAGNVPWEYFERVMPFTDTFLYDVKCVSEDRHEKFTGSKNTLILENLNRLVKTGKDVRVRIPIVSGVNDDSEELGKIKTLLNSLKIEKIEPLPYHEMGAHKYEGLNIIPPYFEKLPKEKFEQIKKFLTTP